MPHETTLVPIVIVGKDGTRRNARVTWGTIIRFMDRGFEVLTKSGIPSELRPLNRSVAEAALALLEGAPHAEPKSPEDIPEEPPIDDPDDPEIPPDDGEVSQDAVTLILKTAKYGPDDDPEFNRISVEVISRLQEKTAVIVNPILIVQVKNSFKTTVDFKEFPVRAGSLNFQQVFSFKSEAMTEIITVEIFMWQNGLPISDNKKLTLSFNAATKPPTTKITGTDFLPWVVVATAGAAFIGDRALKRKRRK